MNITLLGIYESERPRLDSLPTTSVRTLRVSRRQSLTITLEVVNTDGTPFSIASCTVKLGVCRSTRDPWGSVLTKTVTVSPTASPTNVTTFTCTATELDLEPGRYLYSVWVEQPTGTRDPVVLVSPLLVLGSALP